MSAVLFIIIFFFVIIFLIDAIPQFNTWQSRIKIGRFQDRQSWSEKVLKVAGKWLKSTPTIKLTDHSRLIILDMVKGNYKRSTIQSWQEAALVLGLYEYVSKTGDAAVRNAIQNFFDSKINQTGWKVKPTESDHAILGYALLHADFIDHSKYKTALDETYQMILSLKGEDGTVAYKNHNRDYRFVDTIGFICPFLVNYGLLFNIPEAVDLAVSQITEYQKYGMMNEENIPCHTYNVHTKIPTGLFGWGRGIGWFVIGLIDSWNILPNDHPQKKTLEEIIVKTAKSVLRFQRGNGGFNWLVFVKESRIDSSTVATLCWFFTLAYQIPEISEACLLAKEKGLDYLQSVTRRNGAVDFSQGDTKAIGVYSHSFDILPFTQGFVLRTILN
ncbi:glycoside hydrolase family 88 protein [Chryseobacterium sp. R2A-55]|uniref:glycoside hydrolase family 88 protein n=1 Tax=Chryseobacterium sp. R2A-55 TaxID=2744445 RepID=UPI001F2D82BB|nr:glycoside hydrolase family 88 protein [Chryseobacterium sp. R2A-55]